MTDYIVQPEVAGGLGPHSVLDRSTVPVTVTRLHYRIDGWLGSQLLATFPTLVASDEFVSTVRDAGLTGFETAEAEVDVSSEGREMLEGRQLPHFVWFKITGQRGADDFSRPGTKLIVSERGLQVIRPMLGEDVIVEEAP